MKYIVVSSMALLIAGCTYLADPEETQEYEKLRINEVLTMNGSGIRDEFGERSDWIELFNSGDQPINLNEYYLSDSEKSPMKWNLGDQVIQPGEYCLVYASGKDITEPAAALNPVTVPLSWAYAWSDGDIGGNSFTKPWKFEDYIDFNTGQASGVMYVGDNGGVMEWMGEATISIGSQAIQDMRLDRYNQLELFGYLEKDKEIAFSFGQKSWEALHDDEMYLLGLSIPVVGTGEQNDRYVLQLNNSSFDQKVDLNQVSVFNLTNRTFNDSVHFTLDSIRFSQAEPAMHTSFSLSSAGEDLFLTHFSGVRVDEVAVPSLNADYSWGRVADRTDLFGFCSKPTPGKPNERENQTVYHGSTVSATTASGFYTAPVTVQLSTDCNDDIYYTFDGSTPTVESFRYTAPFEVTESRTIRFAPFRDGMISGKVENRTILIQNKPDIPVISIHVDSFALFDSVEGIHSYGEKYSKWFPYFGANFWNEELEISASIEYFERSGNRAFELDLGLAIQGGYSRSLSKKSFALMCRKKYGNDDFNYPFFPSHPELREFSSLILRSGSQHQEHFAGFDVYRTSLTDGMGIAYQKARPVELYINGKYWGLYNLREKLNESYFETNYGIPAENIDLIKEAGVVQSGSADSYIDLITYIKSCDITTEQSYSYINSQMDILNYSDYFSTELYLANNDWPANNIKWWRDQVPQGKWRWAIYDTDGMQTYDFDMIDFIMNSQVGKADFPNGSSFTLIFRKLMDNPTFRSDFFNRTAALLNTRFSPEQAERHLEHIASQTEKHWEKDVERWEFPIEGRPNALSHLREFIRNRPDYMREHMSNEWDLGESVNMTLRSERGAVLVNGISIGSSNSGKWFSGSELTLSLSDSTGFSQWSDGVATVTRTVVPEEGVTLEAQF